MARLLTIALLATALIVPATAGARDAGRALHGASSQHRALDRPARRGPVALALSVAESYWGAVPCGGQIAVRAALPVPATLDPTTDGWVTFESSLGQDDLQAPAATYTRCTISLARWQWPTPRAMASDWNMFCLTVTHEVGHLLGQPHSDAPGSVMAPVFTSEANVPRICRTARAPAADAAGHAHRR